MRRNHTFKERKIRKCAKEELCLQGLKNVSLFLLEQFYCSCGTETFGPETSVSRESIRDSSQRSRHM